MEKLDLKVIEEPENEEPQAEEPVVLGKKKWVDTIELQLVSAAYEILKVHGDVTPNMIADMTVRELLEVVTPNKLRLKLEKA